ncbi:MAG: seryl-tRNA synthetase [Verrucomicrobiales bacterium]|jgi:seryl-tRNA synthetase
MLDIRIIRENPDAVRERVKSRGGDAWKLIDELLRCDEVRRKGETDKQQLQSERKTESKKIGALKKAGEDTSAVEVAMREIGDRIKAIGEEVDVADVRQRELLLGIPNMPHDACPVGSDEAANPEIRIWGEKPQIDAPRDHVDLGTSLGILDFEAGVKIAGSGFIVFRGPGARLERALINFLLDLHTTEHGYTEVGVPFVVNRDCMTGTGQLPKFEDDMYGTENNELFLAPTAEVPVTNLKRDEIVAEDQLPVHMVAYTPCFRREAGSAGRESKGLIRMHQFDKVELVKVEHPDNSYDALEKLTANAEKVLQLLGLHYRVIELCTGDIGASAAKTYDIEVWAPGHGAYLEVSSCSNFEDYQARRMGLRFKDKETKKNRFCHTLNGSGTALPRLYVALLETYQQPDGSIKIPEALQPYFGSDLIQASK